jgi:hypothetical protein
VKHWKSSNSPLLPKLRFSRKAFLYLPAILFASLLGTYLDLYFVGKHFYEFPIRPFPEVFTINIAFTLFAVPLFTWIFLLLIDKMPKWSRLVFIIFLSMLPPIIEKMAVQWGFFRHDNQWNHLFSFFGYFLFLVLIWKIFKCCKIEK